MASLKIVLTFSGVHEKDCAVLGEEEGEKVNLSFGQLFQFFFIQRIFWSVLSPDWIKRDRIPENVAN